MLRRASCVTDEPADETCMNCDSLNRTAQGDTTQSIRALEDASSKAEGMHVIIVNNLVASSFVHSSEML